MSGLHGVSPDELKELELFQYVSPESIEGVLDSCSVTDLNRGEVLLNLYQPNTRLFFILSGQVGIHPDTTETEPIAILGKGEIVGEMSVIDQKGVSAIVVARSDCRFLVMEQDILWSLVQVSHAAACNLLKTLTRRLRGANFNISTRTRLEEELHRYGTYDALSGLHNRHWFNTIFPRQLDRSEITRRNLSLIMIDIDHFKEFNDRFGHLCGDQAIHLVGRVLMNHLRPTELAARYGGDEFVVLLPDNDMANAELVAERLRTEVTAAPIELEDQTGCPPLTISIGVAQAKRGDSPEDLLNAADAALFRAKAKGRNTLST